MWPQHINTYAVRLITAAMASMCIQWLSSHVVWWSVGLRSIMMDLACTLHHAWSPCGGWRPVLWHRGYGSLSMSAGMPACAVLLFVHTCCTECVGLPMSSLPCCCIDSAAPARSVHTCMCFLVVNASGRSRSFGSVLATCLVADPLHASVARNTPGGSVE